MPYKRLIICMVGISTLIGTSFILIGSTNQPDQIPVIKKEKEKPKIPEGTDPHLPTLHVKIFNEYLKSPAVAKYRSFLRALSNYNCDDAKNLIDWTVNQLHLETSPTPTIEIFPNLWVIDIRDYGWNEAAWSTVARREPYFREPFIESNLARELRELTNVDQDPVTLHCESIVRADWFFRDTMESDRSPSYYDLLFAKFRFIQIDQPIINQPQTKIINWPGGIDPEDGKFYAAGHYEVVVKPELIKTEDKIIKIRDKIFKFVKFPKNEKDFEKAFGVDKSFDFIKDSGINTQYGAVVEGGEKGISIVARQNRLIAFTKTPIGTYSKTFDVKETAGKRDFAETLNKDFLFDAGEILTDTPAGGLACLLVNSKGDILETADNRFATDKSDITYDARVRTPGSCFICHESGYIKPNNLIKEMIEKGVDIKFKNKKDAIDARSFFLSWGKKFDYWQEPHITLSEIIFKDSVSKRAAAFKKYRDQYDSFVDLDKACIEIHIPKEKFLLAAIKSPKARINNLTVGISMARKTWEIDDFFEMVKLLNAK